MVPFKVQFADISWNLFQLHILTGISVQLFHVRNIIRGLYQAAHECRHFQVPMPKTQDYKYVKDRQQPLAVPPPKDEYLEEAQSRQTLVIEDGPSLPTPSSINQPK